MGNGVKMDSWMFRASPAVLRPGEKCVLRKHMTGGLLVMALPLLGIRGGYDVVRPHAEREQTRR